MLARFLCITLAIWLGFSSMGFVVNRHFCQNQLQKSALFVQPESCHKQAKAVEMPASCPMHQHMKATAACKGTEEKGCCDSESEYFNLDLDKQIQNFEFKLKIPPLSSFAVPFTVNELNGTDVPAPGYLNYKPPLIHFDLSTLLQRFLL